METRHKLSTAHTVNFWVVVQYWGTYYLQLQTSIPRTEAILSPKHWHPQDYELSQAKNHNIKSKWTLRRMRSVLSLNARTRRHGFSDLCQLIYPLFLCRLSGCRFQAFLYTAKLVPSIRMRARTVSQEGQNRKKRKKQFLSPQIPRMGSDTGQWRCWAKELEIFLFDRNGTVICAHS
jgi:hypothetical protein